MIAAKPKKWCLVTGFLLLTPAMAHLRFPYASAQTPLAATLPAAPPQALLQRTGIVEDEQGKPVAGALVRHITDTTTSGVDGRFILSFPEWKNDHTAMEGIYIASNPDGTLLAYLDITTVKRADAPEPLRLTLHPSKEFTVNVTNVIGAPVFGATVSATLDDAVLGYAQSNFFGVAVLRYPADAPQIEDICAAKPYAGIDYARFDLKGVPPAAGLLNGNFPGPLNLVLDGARPVKFHIIDSHQQPLAGVKIVPRSAYKPGDQNGGANTMLPSPFNLFTETTDAQGNATCAILPAKTQHKTGFSIRKEGYGEKTAVFDPAVDQGAFTITLLSPIHIVTRALDSTGQPVAGAKLHIFGQNSTSSGSYLEQLAPITSTDGTAAVDGDPERYYTFVAQKFSAQQGYTVSPVSGRVILGTSPPVTVDLKLQPALRIHGHLTAGPDNTPLAHFQINLSMKNDSYLQLPADQQLLSGDPSRFAAPILVDSVDTDEQGAFEFYALPGSYTLLATGATHVNGNTNGVRNFTRPKIDFELTTEPDHEASLHVDNLPQPLP